MQRSSRQSCQSRQTHYRSRSFGGLSGGMLAFEDAALTVGAGLGCARNEASSMSQRCIEPPTTKLRARCHFSSPKHYDWDHVPQQHRIDRGRGRSAKRRWEHLWNLSSHHSRHAQMLCMQSSAAAGFPFVARAVAAPIRPRIPAN
jgi:hypothetical protein